MDHLTSYFEQLIRTHRSIEIAEVEFHRMRDEDPELNADYLLWCRENDTTPKAGFRDFCDDFLSQDEEVWDSLSDYDE